MSRTFTRERCMPWLVSRAGVRLDDEPLEVAPSVDRLPAWLPHRAARRLRFAGVLALCAAAIALVAGAAHAEAATTGASTRALTGYALGGLGVGAFLVSRRLGRGAPGLAILCAGRHADLAPAPLTALVGAARKRLAARACPEGHIWLISEAPLSGERRAHAEALGVRCFAPVDGRITEV